MLTFFYGNLHSLFPKRLLATWSGPLLKAPYSSPPPPLLLDRLLVESLGLPLESAASICEKLGTDGKVPGDVERAGSVLGFLKSCGYDEARLAKLIAKRPSLLLSDVESTLGPQMRFLRESGVSDSVLLSAMAVNPAVFNKSVDSFLGPQIDFLKKYLRSADAFDTAIRRNLWLLTANHRRNLGPNIELLMSEGVSVDDISLLMIRQPRALMLKVDRIASIVESVKRLGFEPGSMKFVKAVRVMSSMNESTWHGKVEFFKSLGWCQEDVVSMFMRYPRFLTVSEDKVRRVVELISREDIVFHPLSLTYSIDKRLRPRHNVIKVLLSEGLLEKDRRIINLFKLSDEVFLQNYVMRHLDLVPHLMDIFRGSVTL
ncbi:hypothetical protein ACJRO7_029220 [Eucalyptus globulus]|uniref:Uncharacterized protein n=1 Tax=Eucalyptus globulus TaxID=34317 RepID=A0ABD3K2B1_EUCGL